MGAAAQQRGSATTAAFDRRTGAQAYLQTEREREQVSQPVSHSCLRSDDCSGSHKQAGAGADAMQAGERAGGQGKPEGDRRNGGRKRKEVERWPSQP